MTALSLTNSKKVPLANYDLGPGQVGRCQLIPMWNCNRGKILSRNIRLNLVGSREFSVQPWFIIPLTTEELSKYN